MSNESKGLHFDHINKEGIDINKSCFIQLEGYIGEDYAAVLYFHCSYQPLSFQHRINQ